MAWDGGEQFEENAGVEAAAAKTYLLTPQPHKKQSRCLPWTKTDDRSKTGKMQVWET